MADLRALLPERFHAALTALLTSFDYSQDAGSDPWQFALDLPELLSSGATIADLRWLIQRGFADHARETTIPGDSTRSFRRLAPTSFPPDCCVVLSRAGADAIRSLLTSTLTLLKKGTGSERDTTIPSEYCREVPVPLFQQAAATSPPLSKGGPGGVGSNCTDGFPCTTTATATSPPSQGGGRGGEVQTGRSSQSTHDPMNAPSPRGGDVDVGRSTPSTETPHFDPMLHELRLGEEIVKRFTRPAPAQELILAAFQEEGWPPAIDDPLTAQFERDPKRHLHYTVRNLNRGQKPLRIRFYINGSGETIRWQIVPISAPAARD